MKIILYYFLSSIIGIKRPFVSAGWISSTTIKARGDQRKFHIKDNNDRSGVGDRMQLNMISNLFGKNMKEYNKPTTATSEPSLPRDVKEAISKCREATQAALGDRVSRMNIDFPVGTKFGIEKDLSASKKRPTNLKRTIDEDDTDSSKNPTKEDFDRSDRELARIFVEMFQPVGSENIVVVFNDIDTADIAKEKWKSEFKFSNDRYCNIMSLDRRRKKVMKSKLDTKKKQKPKGFAARIAAEIIEDIIVDDENSNGPFQLPSNTEVAIFVSCGQKEIPIIERICNSVGMGTLVILLNARKHASITNFGTASAKELFLNEFKTVFHLGSAIPPSSTSSTLTVGRQLQQKQQGKPSRGAALLLYRAYTKGDESPWIVARKPTVGPPKTILVTSTTSNRTATYTTAPPTADACIEAYETSIRDLSDVERNVETAIDNVAKWFR